MNSRLSKKNYEQQQQKKSTNSERTRPRHMPEFRGQDYFFERFQQDCHLNLLADGYTHMQTHTHRVWDTCALAACFQSVAASRYLPGNFLMMLDMVELFCPFQIIPITEAETVAFHTALIDIPYMEWQSLFPSKINSSLLRGPTSEK